MTGDVVISVRELSKRFKLYRSPSGRLIEWLTGGRLVRHEAFWALEGVSFDVNRGECVGIIGVNGAGKTTLLKILSRALYPTAGRFEVSGRLVSLLELGTGFHPELTGRQNVFQSARLLGFPEAEVRDRLSAILAFAEIGEFIDRPVKQYSSGMFVRLAFSLFAHLAPDVYIVDEALSVGDVFFQQRCFARFRELRQQGCTILLVSHDMEAITHLCDRAILLSHGKCVAQGDARSVVHDYFALMGQSAADRQPPRPPEKTTPSAAALALAEVPPEVRRMLDGPMPGRHGDTGNGASQIVGFAVTDADGRPGWTVRSGDVVRLWYLVEAAQRIDDLNVGIHFYDRRGILAFAIGTANRGAAPPPLDRGERALCSVSIRLRLAPGEYTLVPQVGGLTGQTPDFGVLHDRLEGLPPVVVGLEGFEGALPPFYGLAELDSAMEWCRP